MQKRSAIINIAPVRTPFDNIYISIKMCGYNLRAANNTTTKRNDQSFKCDTFTKWKRRKRKPYFCCIVYIYYGLILWLFPSGIPLFPPLVSAIVTEASKDNNNGFRSSAADTHPVNSLTKSPSSILDSKDLNEKLLLENFGPGTFASAEEIAADEENDAKLWFDLIQSMEIWQNNKLIRAKRKRAKRDEEVVCYSDVGCFFDDGPFDYLDMLPSDPVEVGTTMQLFTRKHLEKAQLIEYNNITSVLESSYNASLDTKIIIHGFGSSCNRVWPREMRLSFLAMEDVNVICVDWSAGAADPNYVRAAVNTRLVGRQVALLIESINNSNDGKKINDKIHIIGFSLGAHVAGFAGHQLKNLSRITGLDPAGPLFEGYDPNVRLDKTDADYVDVIHSNGDSLIVGGFGTWEPLGHVDFYPNGGRNQRGCQHLLIGGLYDFIYSYNGNGTATYRYLCNHRRAYKFFTDSISPKCYFTAFPCESYDKFEKKECFDCGKNGQECGRLGYYSNLAKGRGSLYLMTREEDPFCGTQYMVSLQFSGRRIISPTVQTYGQIKLMLEDKNGINETFSLTQDVDDLLTSGTKLEKIITVHPMIEPVSAHLLYVAYNGWIYSGRLFWKIDKISLMEGRTGSYLTHCKSNEAETILRSGIPSEFKLLPGDCAVPPISPDYPLFLSPYNAKYPKKPPLEANFFPPINNNEPLNALLPPPPPPPPQKTTIGPKTSSSSSTTTDEFIMDTKIVQLVEAGDTEENSIQINDQVAPQSIPTDTLKKTQYDVEIWDNLAPNSVPAAVTSPVPNAQPKESKITTSGPTSMMKKPIPHHSGGGPVKSLPAYLWRQVQANSQTPKPESSSFWPGFLDFFSGSQENKVTPRPMLAMNLPPAYLDKHPTLRPGLGIPVPPGPVVKPLRVKPQMITLSTKNGTQHQHVTMHHLSDDEHLTILKVDESETDSNHNNSSTNHEQDKDQEVAKSDYIVLHKLPNGEALNLENLETYSSMADVESGIKNTKPVNNSKKPKGLLEPFLDYDMPPSSPNLEMVISERPIYPTPEAYEPIPLEQLEDLEAMPSSGIMETKPIYIVNPLKGDQNISGEILPPTEEEVEEALMQANIELFKINQTDVVNEETTTASNTESTSTLAIPPAGISRNQKYIPGINTLPKLNNNMSAITTVRSTQADHFFQNQTVVYDFNWTPIPNKPTFGPSPAPLNYQKDKNIHPDNVKNLSHLAKLSLNNHNGLAIDQAISRKNHNNNKTQKPVINVQVLPQRLSSVLFHINEKQRSLAASSHHHHHGRLFPGMFRQNKIAPIFKIDPTGLDKKKARSLDSLYRAPPQPRHYRGRFRPNPLRRYQTQLVSGSSNTYRYIPLRATTTTPRPRLWWQPVSMPSTYSSVTIVNNNKPPEVNKELTGNDSVEKKEDEFSTEDFSEENTTTTEISETTTINDNFDDYQEENDFLLNSVVTESDTENTNEEIVSD